MDAGKDNKKWIAENATGAVGEVRVSRGFSPGTQSVPPQTSAKVLYTGKMAQNTFEKTWGKYYVTEQQQSSEGAIDQPCSVEHSRQMNNKITVYFTILVGTTKNKQFKLKYQSDAKHPWPEEI